MDGWEGALRRFILALERIFFDFTHFLYIFARQKNLKRKNTAPGSSSRLPLRKAGFARRVSPPARWGRWLALHVVPAAQQGTWQGRGTAGSGVVVARCK